MPAPTPSTRPGDALVAPATQRVNWQVEPLAVPPDDVRFAWCHAPDAAAGVQRAYRIHVADAESKRTLWDSGRIESPRTTGIAYGGPPLASRRRYTWLLESWRADGEPTRCASWFETAPRDDDWRASWIAMDETARGDAAPLLRRAFHLAGPVRAARVHMAGIGYHELYLNGKRIGDAVLDPAQTDYEHRVLFVTHDLTALLRQGENALGVVLGDGWYAQGKVWAPDFKYGPPGLRLQLEVGYVDGTGHTIVSDGGGGARPGQYCRTTFTPARCTTRERNGPAGATSATTTTTGRTCWKCGGPAPTWCRNSIRRSGRSARCARGA